MIERKNNCLMCKYRDDNSRLVRGCTNKDPRHSIEEGMREMCQCFEKVEHTLDFLFEYPILDDGIPSIKDHLEAIMNHEYVISIKNNSEYKELMRLVCRIYGMRYSYAFCLKDGEKLGEKIYNEFLYSCKVPG